MTLGLASRKKMDNLSLVKLKTSAQCKKSLREWGKVSCKWGGNICKNTFGKKTPTGIQDIWRIFTTQQ